MDSWQKQVANHLNAKLTTHQVEACFNFYIPLLRELPPVCGTDSASGWSSVTASSAWLQREKGIHLYDRYHSVNLSKISSSASGAQLNAPSLQKPLMPVQIEHCNSNAFADRLLCGVYHFMPPPDKSETADLRRSYIMDFKSVLESAGCRKVWDQLFGDAEPIAALGNGSGLAYSYMKGIWPVSARDMSVVLTSAVDEKDDGILLSFATSLDDQRAVGVQNGYVRSSVNVALFHLEYVDLVDSKERSMYLQHLRNCPPTATRVLRMIYMVHVSFTE